MCPQQPIIYSSTNTTFSTYLSEPLLHYLPQHYRTLLWIPFQSASPLLYNYRLGILLTLPTSPLTHVAYANTLHHLSASPLLFGNRSPSRSTTSSSTITFGICLNNLWYSSASINSLNLSDGYTYDSLSSPFHLCFSSHLLFSVYSFYFFFFLLTSMFSEQMVTVKIL